MDVSDILDHVIQAAKPIVDAWAEIAGKYGVDEANAQLVRIVLGK